MIRKFLPILIFTILLIFSEAEAQETTHGAFGALEMKTLSYKNQNELFLGGRFGWVINKKFVVGGGYYSLINSLDINTAEYNNQEFHTLNYGGLELEYYLLSSGKLRPSISVLCGGGGVTLLIPSGVQDKKIRTTLNLNVYEPRLNFEYSLYNWLNIAAGVSYRFVTNLDGLYGIYNKDLSGVNGSLSFRFGDYR